MSRPKTPEELGQRGLFGDLFGDIFSMRPAGPMIMSKDDWEDTRFCLGRDFNLVLVRDDECPVILRREP